MKLIDNEIWVRDKDREYMKVLFFFIFSLIMIILE
jgi:hypothetical protein